MDYIFPAVFHKNRDDSYTIIFPDLPGCISEGKNLGNALQMAQKALTQWIEYLTDKEMEIPTARNAADVETSDVEFVNLVRADIKDNRAVRRTVSIPKWMDDAVNNAGLSLSRVLQDALKSKLGTP